MPVGLTISGELLERLVAAGCTPLQILIAAEIVQFGDGKCHARASHFAKRFGCPKSTIVDTLKRLRDDGIVCEEDGVKRCNLEVSDRTDNGRIRTDTVQKVEESVHLDRTDKPTNRTDTVRSEREAFGSNGSRSPSEVRIKKETKKERTKNTGACAPEGFAEFYALYPRKVGKENAVKAWARLAPSPELRQTISADVSARSKTWDWQKDGGQFVPHPATYLNQQRWTDELPKGNGAVAMRAPQQSALPLNAPSTVEPSAPISTLPAGLTKSVGDLAWWAACLGKIADGMDPDFFREYIGCLEIAGIDGEWLHLEAPTAYIKGNAVWHCDAIEEATGKQVKIHVRDWSQDE